MDKLGLACQEVPGSFVWDEPPEITIITAINFEVIKSLNTGTGGVATEFNSAEVIWKGHAHVACCCDGLRLSSVRAGGYITGKSVVYLPDSYLFNTLVTVNTPFSGKEIGDLLSLAIDKLGEKLPSGMLDPAHNWRTLITDIKSQYPNGGILWWDNHGLNPCQALL